MHNVLVGHHLLVDLVCMHNVLLVVHNVLLVVHNVLFVLLDLGS
jgi:hypothetical protein